MYGHTLTKPNGSTAKSFAVGLGPLYIYGLVWTGLGPLKVSKHDISELLEEGQLKKKY